MARNRGLTHLALAIVCISAACSLLGIGFWMGKRSPNEAVVSLGRSPLPPEILQATATHGASTMAVCTGAIDAEAEGFFALDFITGDLKGWVFNPRTGGFGGLFATNISQVFGAAPAKNAEYLLVSGQVQPPAAGSTTRIASMCLYVVDVRGGQFAAFSIPWDRSMRVSGATQANVFIPIGGDTIRPPIGPGAGAAGPRKPPAGNANPNPNANDPNAQDPNAKDPNAPGKNPNPPKNNQNKNNN
ncbi:MAG: hypothetical protein ACK553_08095 [Planctomycetota bacterium]|jgi:hypothetical protein